MTKAHVPETARTEAAGFAGPVAGLVAFASIGALAVALGPFLAYGDYTDYVALAEGRGAPEPFAWRLLAPWLVRALTAVLPVDARVGLIVLNVAALLGLAAAIAAYLRRSRVSAPTALLILGLPFPFVLWTFVGVPDALAALTLFAAGFAVVAGRPCLAFALGSVAMVSRRTFFAPLLLLAAAAGLGVRTRIAMALVAAVAVGWIAVEVALPPDTANRHGMNEALYLVLKTPVQMLSNAFGLQFWTNDFKWCEPPLFTVSVDWIPGLGSIETVGICTPNVARAAWTFAIALCVFGAIPVLASVFLVRDVRRGGLRATAGDVAACCGAIGLVFWLAAPGFGTAVPRLFLYAYPFFVLAAPWLDARLRAMPCGALFGLALIQAAALAALAALASPEIVNPP